jgi:hypothetical protein
MVVIGAGAAALALAGAAVATGLSYVTAGGDKTRWSVRFMEETKAGKWLNGHITIWALNNHINHLSDAERERFVRDYEEMCQEQGVTPREF